MPDPYLPHEVEILERIQESPTIFTLRLAFTDPEMQASYRFQPGQFNMVYLYGVGEVPISIVSDPEDGHLIDHTIRAVGLVTQGLTRLGKGARLGLRGPYGRGWPLKPAEGRDIVLLTGGLGCAPVVSVIHYILRRRERFGRLTILQGVKHTDDLIWRDQYEAWSRLPDVQVGLAADVGSPGWFGQVGPVTVLFDRAQFDPGALVMMCGPEPMMRAAVQELLRRGVAGEDLWLSMERSMHCAVGHCGHCQMGRNFVCRDGPVFPYPEIQALLGERGF
ncbi:Ni/Fe hydrogenase subunit gamma [Acidithiobacillus sp. 'AMD consortium']|jgi:NAD(P)H-flavin reductase|uniref:Anaerobic sulfite reductase subunit B n=4 Tax=Acidithiobacillus ferridurans TaxID=1232575 RepID=A0A2Z6IJQ9_ACIFI|nr:MULTISPECIES: FAD/NAD(P)-binding protein [Acidithiobacillus]MBU2716215.1 Ni/Fe hydrogenase subunit gamma [Acidithiobacillus ferridurans]MBU2723003.1 Ni/Fe hydrogenase subunit gamma [Acidithiobacillus ferridurans]QFG78140.1 Ni/Fe hydrogenase subunit gamma [Acidithiobacillus sp. 'AMD consortium']RBM00847.1 Ni/Fe hydrogenase subunit gamma [Acidithiobacillus ferridurans]BBF65938.1 Anaerobic sulfite reductase subunit B [Acidithiobacillus ferridurans]